MKVLVTGGSRGIGKAIVDELAKKESNLVYYTYNSTLSEDQRDNCIPIKVDFTDSNELLDFINLVNTWGIDVLVNNYHTGYSLIHAHKLSPTDLSIGMAANIFPTIQLTNALIPAFRKAKAGTIVTILTSAILDFPAGFVKYTAEKRYLSTFVEAWHNENSSYGIKSFALYPGFIPTDIHINLPEFAKPTTNGENELVELLNTLTTEIYAV